MTPKQNKEIAKRFIQEVFVQGNEAAADELAAPDFTPHSWGQMPPGVESLKAAQRRMMAGLSDARITIEDVVAEHSRDADMLGLMPQLGANADESEMRRAS